MKSTFYNEDDTKRKLCDFIMHASQLSMGPKCLEFEKKFSEYQERKYSVMFNSGSSAKLALMQSLKNLGWLKDNDPVGFSAVTWSTNLMPLIQMNYKPIPIDISLETLNVSSKNLEDILKKTGLKALFLTNLLGFCSDIDKIAQICHDNNILLLEDNCESLGSTLKNRKLGNYGIASTFSFFVGHHLSTIEGGMVVTDNNELNDMLKMVRAHGWSRNLSEDKKERLRKSNNIDAFYDQYTFHTLGYNLRPMEINGFIGLEQLKFIEEINRIRNENFLEFYSVASKNKDINTLEFSHMSFVSNFAYPLVFKDKKLFEKYKKLFADANIEIRPIVGGAMTEQPFYKSNINDNLSEMSCPNAKTVHNNGFYFPNNPELTLEEKDTIKKLLLKK